MYGECSLQPLTVDKLSLAEELITGKFSFPYAKEALKQRKSEGDKKRKKEMHDTSIVDDKPATGSNAPAMSSKASPAKSSTKRSRSSHEEGNMTLSISSDDSIYFEPSFLHDTTDSFLLLSDRKRMSNISPMQAADWGITRHLQVWFTWLIFVEFWLSV